ncbi:MAG: integrase [Gammaproteobacteria bacterium]|jgi:integrase
MFNRANYWGYYERENPAKHIDYFTEHSRKRFLHPDEMPRFLLALSESPAEFRDFVLVGLLTGARKSNVLAMRWTDVNFERATWEIPTTKNGDPHVVPLVPEAIEVLRHRRRPPDSNWVFPSASASGHYEEPKRAWETLLNRARIEDLRIHDLRRTVGSWQAALGASLPIIGSTLGHRSIHTTSIYARLSLDPVRASLESATSAMLQTLEHGNVRVGN